MYVYDHSVLPVDMNTARKSLEINNTPRTVTIWSIQWLGYSYIN